MDLCACRQPKLGMSAKSVYSPWHSTRIPDVKKVVHALVIQSR